MIFTLVSSSHHVVYYSLQATLRSCNIPHLRRPSYRDDTYCIPAIIMDWTKKGHLHFSTQTSVAVRARHKQTDIYSILSEAHSFPHMLSSVTGFIYITHLKCCHPYVVIMEATIHLPECPSSHAVDVVVLGCEHMLRYLNHCSGSQIPPFSFLTSCTFLHLNPTPHYYRDCT